MMFMLQIVRTYRVCIEGLSALETAWSRNLVVIAAFRVM